MNKRTRISHPDLLIGHSNEGGLACDIKRIIFTGAGDKIEWYDCAISFVQPLRLLEVNVHKDRELGKGDSD